MMSASEEDIEKREVKEESKEGSKKSSKDEEEIEIDVSKPVPPSKKLMRKLRKAGKIDKEGNWTPQALEEAKKKEEKRLKKIETKYGSGEETQESKRSPWGIWIGNLSFFTTPAILKEFLVREAKESVEQNDEISFDFTPEHITRIHMPMSKEHRNQNKGFAYIDFDSEEALKVALLCTEKPLNGRNVLIKSSNDYQGRPSKSASMPSKTIARQESKNPPSAVIFVGNLPFDATEDLLREHFGQAGNIRRVRLMTFEDSGKCKGFGFVDFHDVETSMKAMTMGHESWRLEYGEDRSKRGRKASASVARTDDHSEKRRKNFDPRDIRPGASLANAARGSIGIKEPTGTKITFD
ncbi:RNA-binding protein Rnp24 [Schizosaccharomyces cryophilus OY26]|uniref:RNA-binding protein Rnp24 n=1 Tax=Schizosaccharomyces cryophilus (strain OY26 / ATCC MYA-4695 / CBS 11777 / NBRC 106824 / NRRL Y48691) TaxID=653667 RepID=S9XHK1_SCHCR|nr:RNA-binding protein Rnp24 [Schizosaccharomyces cryophilus OY26]EPY53156.1 RNA-binding protein Rnp24 [Schizosaccharomyces cryophilus OY26]